MQQKQTPHIIDVIFVLALFGAFAFSAVMLIIAGSSIYRNTINNMQANFETRTSSSYISEKMRQGGKIGTLSSDYGDVLAIYKTVDKREYATYLYCRDGYLCELYAPADHNLTLGLLAAGQKITELETIDVEDTVSENVIEVNLSHKDGAVNRLLLQNYSGESPNETF
ncbi:MAG: DUF4860 domain-containing protein [Lachnospiraceae bacterium]|nr:DUF4860 domain-containing protein [Lachnospiraceae bacterium]MBR1650313.1 DUF4860 domain-containing protein [Lachnospiraceae bacterium]